MTTFTTNTIHTKTQTETEEIKDKIEQIKSLITYKSWDSFLNILHNIRCIFYRALDCFFQFQRKIEDLEKGLKDPQKYNTKIIERKESNYSFEFEIHQNTDLESLDTENDRRNL